MSLADQLAGHNIRLPGYSEGNYKTLCPQCSHTRRNAKDPCLSTTVDREGAIWKCWNCNWTGRVREGDVAQTSVVKFKSKPSDFPTLAPLPENFAQWLEGRGIKRETWESAGVGLAFWFVPAKQQKANCICFPYREPGGKIVNIKFRTIDKEFAQIKGGKKILFGWDRVDLSGSQLVITEGEIDALSFTQAGVENAVSVPDGASDKKLDAVFGEDAAKFERVYIATDSDEKGNELAEELARRFGRDRCWRVQFPEGTKDANDVLKASGEEAVAKLIADAKAYPVKNLHTADEYLDDLIALYRGGRKPGFKTGWPEMDEYMTLRPGELSIVTGIPSSGKSEFVDALAMNLAQMHGWRFGLCSFENPPDEHLAKLTEKRIKLPFWPGPIPRMSEDMVRSAVEWIRDRFYLIRADDDAPTIEMILQAARAAVIRHGITGLVIDPYNEIEQTLDGGTETLYISQMLSKVKRFGQNHGVHVWFIAHPQKPQRSREGEYPELTLYDIAGGAHWANKADIGLVVVRDYTDKSTKVTIKIKKVRFKAVGRPGEVDLDFDRATGTYAERKFMPGSRYSAMED